MCARADPHPVKAVAEGQSARAAPRGERGRGGAGLAANAGAIDSNRDAQLAKIEIATDHAPEQEPLSITRIAPSEAARPRPSLECRCAGRRAIAHSDQRAGDAALGEREPVAAVYIGWVRAGQPRSEEHTPE